jgi:hypothetical protein
VVTPLVDADPVALAVAYLASHPDVTAAHGATGRVDGRNRQPYPRTVITDPPGSDGALRWLTLPTLQVEVLGDVDGRPGKAVLRRILYTVLGALMDWPSMPVTGAQPVVTDVTSRVGGGWVPLGNGQPRYVATVQIGLHPPRV